MTETFDYDGWLLVSEQSASGGNLSTNYHVWSIDLSGSMQGAGGIGGLLATVAAPSVRPSWKWLLRC